MEHLVQKMADHHRERENRSRSFVELLSQVGAHLINSSRVSGAEIQLEHDVHAFFRSSANPDRVIHVQTYPGLGLSQDSQVCIAVREMDYQKLMEIRAAMKERGGPSIGNEGEAVRRVIVNQTDIPHSPEAVVRLLENELPSTSIIDGQGTERPNTPPLLSQ